MDGVKFFSLPARHPDALLRNNAQSRLLNQSIDCPSQIAACGVRFQNGTSTFYCHCTLRSLNMPQSLPLIERRSGFSTCPNDNKTSGAVPAPDEGRTLPIAVTDPPIQSR